MVVVGMPTLRARGLAFPVITLAFGLVTSDFLLNTGYSPFKQLAPRRLDRAHAPVRRDPARDRRRVLLPLGRRARAGRHRGPGSACEPDRAGAHRRSRQRARRPRPIRFGHATRSCSCSRSPASSPASRARCSCSNSSCSSTRRSRPSVSLQIFAMVVVGGLGSISGAVLGAAFVYGVQYFLPARVRVPRDRRRLAPRADADARRARCRVRRRA